VFNTDHLVLILVAIGQAINVVVAILTHRRIDGASAASNRGQNDGKA
jgi:hypothetical protein